MAKDDEFNDSFESVYNDDGREELIEDDEISPQEEAFMAGYDEEEVKKKDENVEDPYEKAFAEQEEKKNLKPKGKKK